MVPLDRARRVVLGTTIGHLEQVLERIRGGITSEKHGLGGYLGQFWYFNKRSGKSDGTIG